MMLARRVAQFHLEPRALRLRGELYDHLQKLSIAFFFETVSSQPTTAASSAQTTSVSMSEKARGSRQRRNGRDRRVIGGTGVRATPGRPTLRWVGTIL